MSALRLSSNHDSPAVWEAIVRTTLLGPDGSESEHVSFESIELVTSLKDSVSLTLVWRRKDAAGSTVRPPNIEAACGRRVAAASFRDPRSQQTPSCMTFSIPSPEPQGSWPSLKPCH